MEKEHREFFSGSEVDRITMIRTVKGIMIDLFRGYPAYKYWGIIEGRFGDKNLGERVRDTLEKDGFIEIDKTRIPDKLYRLTSRGVDLAISMINLNYGEKILAHSNQMNKFTITLILLAIINVVTGTIPLILNLLQN
jgi:hypothetical protein